MLSGPRRGSQHIFVQSPACRIIVEKYLSLFFVILYEFIIMLCTIIFFAPKASAEGACILSKLGDSYEVWLVTVVVVCVVTVMV